jgi:hypothetical protein
MSSHPGQLNKVFNHGGKNQHLVTSQIGAPKATTI